MTTPLPHNLVHVQPDIWEQAPETLRVSVKKPKPIPEVDDSLEFHAARLLMLIYYAGGKPKTKVKQIDGRIKLAKMDFLIRYPTYLVEAAHIRNQTLKKKVEVNVNPTAKPESRMIRYKYGPWDAKYYDVFALLLAKDFVEIRPNSKHGDSFILTDKGQAAVEELDSPEFDEIVKRCRLVYDLFGENTGNFIKDFIYKYFTEILDKAMREEIKGK